MNFYWKTMKKLKIGSQALGDAILDNLGIPKRQTHTFNLFGTVFKLELPEEDIASVQQWEKHKQAAIFESFLSFIAHKLKFKVSGLDVKLNRSKDSSQTEFIEPITGPTNNNNSNRDRKSSASATQTESSSMHSGISIERPRTLKEVDG